MRIVALPVLLLAIAIATPAGAQPVPPNPDPPTDPTAEPPPAPDTGPLADPVKHVKHAHVTHGVHFRSVCRLEDAVPIRCAACDAESP